MNMYINTCISLSSGFLLLSGLGAYGGRVLAMLLADAAMTATCSSVSSDGGDGVNVSGDTSELCINYMHTHTCTRLSSHSCDLWKSGRLK